MRLEGSLDAFSLPDIFALLSMTKKTGGLHLRRADEHGIVWVAEGLLTGGTSEAARQSLARRVVNGADIDADALRSAIARSESDGIGLVTALAQSSALDEALLHDLASEHIVDTVFDLLRWDVGDFEFVVDESDRDATIVSRAVDDVVGEARRRLDEWAEIRDTLPRPDAVLHLAATPGSDVLFDHDQWSLILLADGRRSVADLVAMSGRGEYATVRCLSGLVEAGVLTVKAEAGVAAIVDRVNLLDGVEGHIARPAPSAAKSEGSDHADPEADLRAESAADSGLDEAAQPVVTPAPVVDDSDSDDDVAESQESEESEDDHTAEVTEISSPFRAAGRDLTRVTPQRPEPFIPQRQPEHPEVVGPTTVGALAAAPEPVASTHIERDPSVNKSLLLRLIAGVRGL